MRSEKFKLGGAEASEKDLEKTSNALRDFKKSLPELKKEPKDLGAAASKKELVKGIEESSKIKFQLSQIDSLKDEFIVLNERDGNFFTLSDRKYYVKLDQKLKQLLDNFEAGEFKGDILKEVKSIRNKFSGLLQGTYNKKISDIKIKAPGESIAQAENSSKEEQEQFEIEEGALEAEEEIEETKENLESKQLTNSEKSEKDLKKKSSVKIDKKPKIKKEKTYVYSEKDRLGNELAIVKRKLKEAQKNGKNKNKDYFEKRVAFFQEEFNKAKEKRDEIELKEKIKAEKKEKETAVKPKIIEAPEELSAVIEKSGINKVIEPASVAEKEIREEDLPEAEVIGEVREEDLPEAEVIGEVGEEIKEKIKPKVIFEPSEESKEAPRAATLDDSEIDGLFESPEGANKKEKKAENFLVNEKRAAYLEVYKKLKEAKKEGVGISDLLLKMRQSKEEYDESKIKYGRELLSNAKQRLEGKGVSGEKLSKILERYEKWPVFKELVVNENLVLQKEQIEQFPPKEKNIARNMLDWYLNQGKYTRIAISTALVTGAVALSGGFSAVPAAALMFAGQRYVKGALSVGIGQYVGKGVDWIYSKLGSFDKEKAISKLKTGFSVEKLAEVENDYHKILEESVGAQRKKLIIKAAAMIASGAGASIGLNMLEQAMPSIKLTAGEWLLGKKPEVESGVEIEHPLSEAYSPDVKTKVAEISAEIRAGHQADLATIKQGEGVWHAVYRQLEDRLYDDPKKFGLSQEDLTNAEKIKSVLNRQTNQLLVEQGYIKVDGTEIRIAKPGVEVLLGDNNEINIKDAGESTYVWKKPEISEVTEISNEKNLDKILENFNNQNLAEKERLVNLYNSDIEAMEGNLANGLGSEEEIDRLKDIRDALMSNRKFEDSRQIYSAYLGFLERKIGLTGNEYEAIKGIKVDKFLEENKGSWLSWGKQKHYENLAEIINSLGISESDKGFFTIEQIIKSKISGNR
ncbi:MAG: hypothetical protein AAB596_01695 [Patescibacteria group bacterium]